MRTSRICLVTGGTDGIGRAVALELACSGEHVLFVGRNVERGEQVLQRLRALNPHADHRFFQADLSLLADTARLAQRVTRLVGQLDAVVCCAGVLSTVPEWTAEGLERNFVLNYLSRYLLVRRVLGLLAQSVSGRLVLVANAGNYRDTLDFNDLQLRRGRPGLHVSGRTQFANDLLAIELADRLRHTRIEVSCVFPGVSNTSVFRNARGLPRLFRAVVTRLLPWLAQRPEDAARTPVFLARDPHAYGCSGRFFGPRLEPRKVPERARRSDRRTLLWHSSEALVRDYLQADINLPALAAGHALERADQLGRDPAAIKAAGLRQHPGTVDTAVQ